MSAIWSQSGGSHYSGANAVLDGVSASRQHSGLPGCSLQLGPFSDVGMAADHTSDLEAIGLRTFLSSELRDVVQQAGVPPNQAFVRLKIKHFVALHSLHSSWDLLQRVTCVPEEGDSIIKPKFESEKRISGSHTVSHNHITYKWVKENVKNVFKDIFGNDTEEFDEFPPGSIDSVSAIEFSSALASSFSISLPVTVIFDYPSVSGLSQYICSVINKSDQHDRDLLEPRSLIVPEENLDLKGFVPLNLIGFSRSEVSSLYLEDTDAIDLVPYGRWDLDRRKVGILALINRL